MNVICRPAALAGTVAAIPSKSDAHRKLICAALSENGGTLALRQPHCADIEATLRCIRALGVNIADTGDSVYVSPITEQPYAALDCGESGSTLRFLLPVAMAVCKSVSVTGSGRLPERPISALTDAMSAHGVQFDAAKLPLNAKGQLTGGAYEIAGNISSQFLSGLLMALPLCKGDSVISLTTALQSQPYVELTLSALRTFGADIIVDTENLHFRYHIKGGQKLRTPAQLAIDGDWSNAAFWLAAGALSQTGLTVSGLSADSIQGDKAILDILRTAGADVSSHADSFTAAAKQILPFDADLREIPDLLPILAVCASFANGDSHFTHAERLRLKESDRLSSVAAMLTALGGRVTELPDGLIVHGGGLTGGTVDAQNDHRLVMAAAVAALYGKGEVTILGAEAVDKSYPRFFEDYRMLGGIAEQV